MDFFLHYTSTRAMYLFFNASAAPFYVLPHSFFYVHMAAERIHAQYINLIHVGSNQSLMVLDGPDICQCAAKGKRRHRNGEKGEGLGDSLKRVNVCVTLRVGPAFEHVPPSFFPSSWPLTSVAYNKNYLDQSHLACRTLQTHQNQITPLPYPFPRQAHRHQASSQRLGSPKNRIHRLRQMGTLLDFIVIDFAKNWALPIRQSSSIALTKTASGRDTGSGGAHTCLIGNGFVLGYPCLTPSFVFIIPPGNRQGRLLCRRGCLGTLSP